MRLHRHQLPGGARRHPQKKLLTIASVYQALAWRTPNGCSSCRPAINHYPIGSWPKEAKDDPQSRFINERSHANIQKDGTYSVIPRLWGGETTASELRRIADAVDKYKIPTVKVTGGQRMSCWASKRRIWSMSGRTSACPVATPMPRRCAR